ncbi:hypothetical protein [Bradyrhizobium sp. BR 10261]|nr:hypothetical protein [Bradyrhizobium sp. BR 10261]
MGRIGFAIIIAAFLAYEADTRWNERHYTDSTLSVLRHLQRTIGL